MFLRKLFYTASVFLILLNSCSNVDDAQAVTPIEVDDTKNDNDTTVVSKGPFEKGVFISNEGNFMTPNASLSFISNDFTKKYDSIYYRQNNKARVGDVFQSMAFYKDKAFLIVNNSNKIIVANRYTLKKEFEITQNVEQPRYVAIVNDRLFVTNIISQSVMVYSAKDYSFLKAIKMNENIEHIVSANNKLYVQKSYFRSGKRIAVINPSTYAVDKTITVSDTINNIITNTNKNVVYVLSSKKLNKTTETSTLYKIDTQTDEVAETNTFQNVSSARKLRVDNENLYFIDDVEVYQLPENTLTAQPKKLFEVTSNSWSTFYGFNVIDNKIYRGDSKGFVANGEVTIYNLQGVIDKQFTVAMGPNHFYKNN